MSVFLDRPASEHVASNALAFALRDAFPVSPGHTLVIPRRVVATWFDATREEQLALLDLVDQVKRALDAELHPDGYNVGFNAGTAAGQTVMHLHVHVIPRYRGDVGDPRGGVRHVIPGKGNYLVEAPDPLATGGTSDPFSAHVLPWLVRASTVDIVSAFVQESGLVRIGAALQTALDGGATVRLITGDYLAITQVSALERLLDWQEARRGDDVPGDLETRVIEVERLGGRSFHPKAWHLAGDGFGVAFVGSSNLSRSALEDGVEWNLRVDRATHAAAFHRVHAAFEDLWATARPLDAAWVAAYALRARARPTELPPGEVTSDPVAPPPTPHDVQREALAALRDARASGRRRALVVLATGLGKTLLAAFDCARLWDELGRQPRVLFLAHRRELLRQAAQVYRTIVRERGGDPRVGWLLADQGDLDAPLVFASVAKLARPAWLDRLRAERFDYVVVDEVHHAAADSYRRILGALDPRFLLGLTATPDRADAADVEGLFDDFTAYRADIGRGIDVGRLVPFRYHGVRDDIDYRNIPWRNRRFDPEALAAAAQTEARMRTMWSAWQAHPGARTLLFCCSIAHTDHVASWLAGHGVRVAKVYSGPGSDDRDGALDRLAAGTLDAVCAVDVFNEGVDVPAVDRVVMLRPTESSVVFLQQLGRGLRAAPGKDHLAVVDFVGNHQLFVDRLRTLLSLGGPDEAAARLARLVEDGHVDLPAGCSVDLVLEAKRALEERFRATGADAVERTYRQLRASRGARPTAGELVRAGASLDGIRRRHGSFLAFVASEGDLDGAHHAAWEAGRAFLADLETTPMTRSFKMVALQVLLDAGEGVTLTENAARSWEILARSPELLRDVPPDQRPSVATDPRWVRYWRSNPIAAWTTTGKDKRAWLRLDPADRLVLDVPVPDDVRPAFSDLVRELVDLRLVQYRRRDPIVHGGRPPEAVGEVVQLHPIASYPDLRAAAGVASEGAEPPEADQILLPVEPAPGRFAVRVVGSSMDGGTSPLRDGDWAVLRFARGAPAASLVGRVVLVEVPGAGHGSAWQLKRLVADGAGFRLVSDHPDGPSFPVTDGVDVVARLESVVRPEDVPISAFPELPRRTGRAHGHLFVVLDGPGTLETPTSAKVPGGWRASETAFVLAKIGEEIRPIGVGRQAGGGMWRIPEVDFATWRALGAGRSASRDLPEGAEERADALAAAVAARAGEVLRRPNGSELRIAGRTAGGGLRLEGEGSHRTVSLTDLAWVVVAAEAARGAPVDEEGVNRLRYLDGTPKASTRFIDTGWAIAAWELVRGR